MSDNQTNDRRNISDEEVSEALEDLGYEVRSNDVPLWRKVKCRLLGPHDWVPVHSYDVITKRLTEDGMVCDTCRKESG